MKYPDPKSLRSYMIAFVGSAGLLLLISCADGLPKNSSNSELALNPIDTAAFTRSSNGEGYSGPSFFFKAIESIDAKKFAERMGARYMGLNRCWNEGAYERRGLTSALQKILGQIYGANPSPELEEIVKSKLGSTAAFKWSPFPSLWTDTVYDGIKMSRIENNLKITVDNLLPTQAHEILVLDPETLSVIRLRTPNVPNSYFIPTGLDDFISFGPKAQTLAAEFAKTRTLFFASEEPNEGSRMAEILDNNETRVSDLHFNSRDFFECLAAEFQLAMAEASVEKELVNRTDRTNLKDWLFKYFTGSYELTDSKHGSGTLEIKENARIVLTTAQASPALHGEILEVYRTHKSDNGLDHYENGSHLEEHAFRIKILFQAEKSTFESMPLWMGLANSYSFQAGSEDPKIPEGQLRVTVDWLVSKASQAGLQLTSGYGHSLLWRRLKPVSTIPPVEEQLAKKTSCEIFDPWLQTRWNSNLKYATDKNARIALYDNEYKVRRETAKRLFDEYWATGRLSPDLFEDCLADNSERQNFLNTLSAVFSEETLGQWKRLAQESGSTRLSAFITEYEKNSNHGLAFYFRMTGHKGSESGNPMRGGVLKGAPAIFMNVFDMSPKEWLVIWLHEMSHAMDKDLTENVILSMSLGKELVNSPNDMDLWKRWIKASLAHGLNAEVKAWDISFQVYAEVKDHLPKSIAWMDQALLYKAPHESFRNYTQRFLVKLNRLDEDQILTDYIRKSYEGLGGTASKLDIPKILPLFR